MAVRSINKNGMSYETSGFGEQWDMPEYLASGSVSDINPSAVKSPDISQTLAAIQEVTNPARSGYETGGPGTRSSVTTPIISAVKEVAEKTGDTPVISVPPKDVRFTKTNGGNGDNGDSDLAETDKDIITPDQIYDAQGNFLSAGMNISKLKNEQLALENRYLLQEAPSWFFDKEGNRKRDTMSKGKGPSAQPKGVDPTEKELSDWNLYNIQLENEDIWFKKAREEDKPGYVPRKVDEPRISELLTTDEDDPKGVENVESGLHETATVVGTDESGKEIVEVAGNTVLASQDSWSDADFQSAWAAVQSGAGVPTSAIRTVQVPYRTLDPETGDIVTIMRSEISPQTQLLLEENARLAGIRQASESRQLNQYTSILQNPRAAAAMRIMEQMGLGGIAQLLGTPQPQQVAPSMAFQGLTPGVGEEEALGLYAGDPTTPVQALQTQLLPDGMTEEQLRLRQMWGGGMIPTTGFLSGTDPDRLAISQALQSIAGFSPEQTFSSSVGVTPGVTPSYQVPRLLAMRR